MRLQSQGSCWALATMAHLSSEQRDSFQVLRLETRTSTGQAKPCLLCLQTNCFPPGICAQPALPPTSWLYLAAVGVKSKARSWCWASLISISRLAAKSFSRIEALAVELLFSQITEDSVLDDYVCDETGYRSYFRSHSVSHLNLNMKPCQRHSI